MTTRLSARLFGMLAGLYGAAGVALAAAGAHLAGSPSAATAANFLLFHAAALLGLCGLTARRYVPVSSIGGYLLAAGTFVFSGDLALRSLANVTLVHLAAPSGGIVMILGWLTLAFSLPVELGRSDST